jgi:hypothetical protein
LPEKWAWDFYTWLAVRLQWFAFGQRFGLCGQYLELKVMSGIIIERKIKPNPMTNEQRKHIYFLLNRLNLTKEVGDEMCPEWTSGRASRISELGFIDAQQIIKYLKGLMQTPRSSSPPSGELEGALDRKRKGVIKACFRWYELQGKVVKMDYVLGTICKAGGVRCINDLTETDLQRLYAEFCRKQKVLQELNGESKYVFSNN